MIAGSSTLFRYIFRRFFAGFGVIMAVLMGVVYLFTTIDLMRRAASHEGVPFRALLAIAALDMPQMAQMMLPFGVLFSAIYTCWKLNKTHELVVIRAAGVSAWQFLSPMLVAALLTGVFATAVLNPVSSTLLAKHDQLVTIYLQKNSNLVTVSRTGIWLRQPTQGGYALIRSGSFDESEWRLSTVTVFFFDNADNFLSRIDSPVAYLKEGYWEFRDALVNERSAANREDLRRLPTELTAQKIEESFADPDTISFWSIPEYIYIMEETGFPTTPLHIHFQALLAQPFLFMAMVLLAATFSLRPPRFGGTGGMIVLGVAIGFFIFFMESMLHAFGISQKIPVYLAAWTPAAVSLLLGTTALLHLEDG
ncbi:MAG: LPS export ABC transporter permease LptG [Alphaproteobacteria bacterium]